MSPASVTFCQCDKPSPRKTEYFYSGTDREDQWWSCKTCGRPLGLVALKRANISVRL